MKTLLITAVAVVTLAACGSRDDSAPAPPAAAAEVPASAGANVETFVGYVAALPADDQREPLGVDAVEPPTSDGAEPLAVQ